MKATTHGHQPDKDKIPAALRVLNWVANDNTKQLWGDGQELLVAVPVCTKAKYPDKGWHYEFSVVTIRCDEAYFSIECDGNSWGWHLSDADWFVMIRS